MAGYVALQRIDRVSVRALAWHGSIRVEGTVRRERPAVIGAGRLAERSLAGPLRERPLPERISERWAIVREQWAITTFFLFDPESWR